MRVLRRVTPASVAVCACAAALAFSLRPALRAEDWAPNLTLDATWVNNASNANLPGDQIDALRTRADLLASERYGLGRDDSLHPAFHAGAEWWPRYQGLTTGALGARVEWQHKFGMGPLAPVLALGGGGDFVAARESGRRGTEVLASLGVRKRFGNLWRAALVHEWSQHSARAAVFDRTGNETTLEVARDVTDVARFTFALRYRSGDVISYATPPRPDLVTLAPHRLDVETFGRPMVAYSVDAPTVGARLGLIRAIDEHSAITASYEYRTTERSPLRYVNHLVSLGIVHQF